MSNKNKTGESFLVKVLSLIIILSVSGNIILLSKRTNTFPAKKELMVANEKLVKQVNKYKMEINKFKGISSQIDIAVRDANAVIESKEKQISQLKREKRFKETENQYLSAQLDSINEKYIGIIDSLLVEREKTKIINNKIEGLEDIIQQLNLKIGVASLIAGDNLKITPWKKNNAGKRTETALAKKTSEIDICFDILENKISKSGLKKIYFVVTSPNAEILIAESNPSQIFYHPEFKKDARYSALQTIDYKNQKIQVCATIKPEITPLTGLYVVEIFSEENKLGTKTFSLK